MCCVHFDHRTKHDGGGLRIATCIDRCRIILWSKLLCGVFLFVCLFVFLNFLFTWVDHSVYIQCTKLFSHDSKGGVYKLSGVTLIGTDCEIFVIHCTCPTSQMQEWSEQRWKHILELSRELNWVSLAPESKTLTTVSRCSSHKPHEYKLFRMSENRLNVFVLFCRANLPLWYG